MSVSFDGVESNYHIGGKVMYYEINVSKDGVHLFATAERSIPTASWARKVLEYICEKFPESEGFSVTIFRWEKTGTGFTPEEFFEMKP